MVYLDTGCLLKLYYPEPESAQVAALVAGKVILLTSLHVLELTNAVELKRFRKQARTAQIKATMELFEEDQRTGVLHRPVVQWEDVYAEAQTMATSHSRTFGGRSLDILHCAVAKQLAVATFLTTDARQKLLATAIGLPCPQIGQAPLSRACRFTTNQAQTPFVAENHPLHKLVAMQNLAFLKQFDSHKNIVVRIKKPESSENLPAKNLKGMVVCAHAVT